MEQLVRLQIDESVVSVSAGSRVVDVLDDYPELGLPVSCRSGHCGTCYVRVLSAARGVAKAAAGEQGTLAELGLEEGRLACQLVLTGEVDLVVLRTR